MATVLSLGMQLTASASGMAKGLSDADRQLQSLARQADAAGKLFDGFTGATAAAAAAQAGVATEFKLLADTLKAGLIDADGFKQGLAEITASAQQQAAAFADGARITEQVATAEEKRAATLARLDALLEQGAINQQTYDRAAADASGANAEAAKAEAARAQALSRAAAIIQANLTPQQKYDQEVLELTQHLQAGRINQDTFNAAVAKATQAFVRAESAARGYDQVIQNGIRGGTLQFNELSGILAALPGPIGNVAGRLSGLASAGEGLGRIFSGGLSTGLQGVGASVAGLVNPITAGIAAVAAFSVGGVAAARGLVELEDRVESLGNLSDKLGVSFEFVQELEEAGKRSGVSVDSVSTAMGRLQKTLAGADEESKQARASLDRLGLTFGELDRLNTEDQIRLIGSRLQGITDPAQRTAAAMALFGRAGADLLPFFRNLPGAADDIARLGGSLNAIDRRRIDEFGAGIDALRRSTTRLGELLVLPFTGLGEGIAQGLADFIGGINRVAAVIGDILAPELNTLGNVFQAAGVVASATADVFVYAFSLVRSALEPLGGGILPAIGAGIALINRQILIGAVSSLAGFFSAAAAAAFAYASGAVTASISTAALGVAIRSAINSTGVGVLVTAFGLAAGALLEWAFAADDATGNLGNVGNAAENAAQQAARLAEELAKEDASNFEEITRAIGQAQEAANKAADEATQFGEAGVQAAFQFQEAIRELQRQADPEIGILNATALANEVEKARAAYERQLQTLRDLKQAEEDRAKAAERAAQAAIAADQKRADAFIDTQNIGAETPQQAAAENLLAIIRQIDEVETAIVQARADNDAAGEQSALRRLAILDQAQAAAQEAVDFGFTTRQADTAIRDVREELDDVFTFDNITLAPEAFGEAQRQLQQLEEALAGKFIEPEQFKAAADQIRKGFEDGLATASRINDLQLQYAEQAAEIDAERADALSRVSQEPLRVEDVRTSGGFAELMRLASGRDDPAIEEARKQTQQLNKIAAEIRKLGGAVEMI
jgi:hypothetical protein